MEIQERISLYRSRSSEAYRMLTSAVESKFDADRLLTEARAILEMQKIEAFESGAIDGKNAETRKAQLIAAVSDFQVRVDRCESLVREAELELELAKIKVRDVSAQIRLTELEVRYTSISLGESEFEEEF